MLTCINIIVKSHISNFLFCFALILHAKLEMLTFKNNRFTLQLQQDIHVCKFMGMCPCVLMRQVVLMLLFLSPLTHRSLKAGHSYHDTSGQVRVVIAMMTGRKKIEQGVLAVLFGEEARKGGAEKGEWWETGIDVVFRDSGWMRRLFSPTACILWMSIKVRCGDLQDLLWRLPRALSKVCYTET